MNAVVSETQVEEAPAKKAKPVAEVVAMSDGRNVEFAGKRKLLKDYVIDEDGTIHILLDFRNGETRNIILPTSLIPQFAAHGALQKYGDETAGEDDVDDMVLAIDALDERIQKGEWSIQREGGSMAGTSVLIKALMEYGNRTVEQVKAFLKDKSQQEKIALRNNATKANADGKTIKSIVQRLEEEKIAKAAKVNTDEMLAGL
ncbi:unnamed protein product [Sphagnum balticum]